MFGIAGAHRTGKTTLGVQLSEATGVKFVRTSASETFKRMGLDPKAQLPLIERLEVQSQILMDMAAMYHDAGKVFITDRTPMDAYAYMMADITRGYVTMNKMEQVNVEAYLQLCLLLSEKYFRFYLILQPGIPLIEAEGKAPANPIYIEHLNLLVAASTSLLCQDHSRSMVVDRSITDMATRLRIGEMMLYETQAWVRVNTGIGSKTLN